MWILVLIALMADGRTYSFHQGPFVSAEECSKAHLYEVKHSTLIGEYIARGNPYHMSCVQLESKGELTWDLESWHVAEGEQ